MINDNLKTESSPVSTCSNNGIHINSTVFRKLKSPTGLDSKVFNRNLSTSNRSKNISEDLNWQSPSRKSVISNNMNMIVTEKSIIKSPVMNKKNSFSSSCNLNNYNGQFKRKLTEISHLLTDKTNSFNPSSPNANVQSSTNIKRHLSPIKELLELNHTDMHFYNINHLKNKIELKITNNPVSPTKFNKNKIYELEINSMKKTFCKNFPLEMQKSSVFTSSNLIRLNQMSPLKKRYFEVYKPKDYSNDNQMYSPLKLSKFYNNNKIDDFKAKLKSKKQTSSDFNLFRKDSIEDFKKDMNQNCINYGGSKANKSKRVNNLNFNF